MKIHLLTPSGITSQIAKNFLYSSFSRNFEAHLHTDVACCPALRQRLVRILHRRKPFSTSLSKLLSILQCYGTLVFPFCAYRQTEFSGIRFLPGLKFLFVLTGDYETINLVWWRIGKLWFDNVYIGRQQLVKCMFGWLRTIAFVSNCLDFVMVFLDKLRIRRKCGCVVVIDVGLGSLEAKFLFLLSLLWWVVVSACPPCIESHDNLIFFLGLWDHGESWVIDCGINFFISISVIKILLLASISTDASRWLFIFYSFRRFHALSKVLRNRNLDNCTVYKAVSQDFWRSPRGIKTNNFQ